MMFTIYTANIIPDEKKKLRCMIRALKPEDLPVRGVGAVAVLVVRGVWEETHEGLEPGRHLHGDHVHLRAEGVDPHLPGPGRVCPGVDVGAGELCEGAPRVRGEVAVAHHLA